MHFKELGLIDPILKALSKKGYEKPTPIQEQSIPIVLERKDLLGIAQTGTGKTAAFTLPIIQQIQVYDKKRLKNNHIRALILTPTRELAIQINDNLQQYTAFTEVKHTVIFGGVKQHRQVQALRRGAHILVATPGRLLDLIGQGIVHLDDIKMFVLDEADRMLDMGFIHDIKKIIRLLPKKRQSLFFSATMPDAIAGLSKDILNQPERVEIVPENKAADTVKQYVYKTERQQKTDLLRHIIEEEGLHQLLVFTRTKHGADRLAKKLSKAKYKVASIHGNKTQGQRQKALQNFKANKVDILVATDIAARGIDIAKLEYVVNYDLPNEPESYIHRIGRSGRAGESGIAISLCEPEELGYLKAINKLVNHSIVVIDDHPYPQTSNPMTEKEKKAWNKEKQARKKAFFENRSKRKFKGRSADKGKNQQQRNSSKKKNRSNRKKAKV